MTNKNQFENGPNKKGGLLRHIFKADASVNAASLLPIRLTLVYLIFSIAVYVFGPINWTTHKPVLFYSLLCLYLIALWLGYRVGAKKNFSKSLQWKSEQMVKVIPILSLLIVVNYLVYAVNIFREYGMQTFDFSELFSQMAVGIRNPGLGYALRNARLKTIDGRQIIGGRMFTLFNYMWSFVRYPILLMGMLNFGKLKIWGKAVMVLYLATMSLFYLSIGTTIDILHVFLLMELPVIISTFTKWYKREMNKKHIIKLIASLLAGALFVFSYFTWMMVSRGGINNYDKPGYNIGGVQLSENVVQSDSEQTQTSDETTPAGKPSEDVAPTEKPLDTVPTKSTGFRVPPIIMKFWISFSSYFTQGYYGLSQAMTLPWTPMYGLGSSMFVVDFVSEHVYDIDQFTYQMKVEKAYGWNSNIQWNSMYTWLANDVSFYGVVIVLFLIGMLFGAMFKDAISTENPFAKMSVFYFILMMLFIPCNNQIAQRPDTMFSFALIVFCWLISKYPPKILQRILQREK